MLEGMAALKLNRHVEAAWAASGNGFTTKSLFAQKTPPQVEDGWKKKPWPVLQRFDN